MWPVISTGAPIERLVATLEGDLTDRVRSQQGALDEVIRGAPRAVGSGARSDVARARRLLMRAERRGRRGAARARDELRSLPTSGGSNRFVSALSVGSRHVRARWSARHTTPVEGTDDDDADDGVAMPKTQMTATRTATAATISVSMM